MKTSDHAATGTAVHYFPPEARDIGRVVAMARTCFADTFAHLYEAGPFNAFLEDAYGATGGMARDLLDRGIEWRVAGAGDQVIGYAKLRALSAPAPSPQHGALELQQIYVLRDWQGRGVAFPRKPQRRLECTLLVLWAAGREDGWYVLTDLAPQDASGAWYGLRSWIEAGFRHIKSEGWHWERTRMTDPARAERLWLAIAVAECWVQSHAEAVSALFPGRPHLVSAHRRGLGTLRWRLRRGPLGLNLGAWHPQEWPAAPPGVISVPCQEPPYDPRTRNPPQ